MAGAVWMDWPLGARVTIRRRLPEGGYSDWVGGLEQASPDRIAVRRRSGELRWFEAGEIAIAHLVPSGRRPDVDSDATRQLKG
ncbi:MAG: hypothetical protein LBD90_00010 [Bifidobacteriaceae bacterium]|nr:hypothetical protein [Bifidobacteriaceae bacterium]